MRLRGSVSGVLISLTLGCGLATVLAGSAMAGPDAAIDDEAPTSKPQRPGARPPVRGDLQPVAPPRRDSAPEPVSSQTREYKSGGIKVIRYGRASRTYSN